MNMRWSIRAIPWLTSIRQSLGLLCNRSVWGLLLVGLVLPVRAAVLFDQASSGNTLTELQTQLSFNVNIGNNTNRLVVLGTCSANGAGDTATGTLNGVPLTPILDQASTGTIVHLWLFYMVNPPVGSPIATFTLSNARRQAGGAISLYNVLQAPPVEGAQEAANATDTTSISIAVSTVVGDLVADMGCKRDTLNVLTMGAQSGRTERWQNASTDASSGNNVRAGGSTRTGTGSLTMNWSGVAVTGFAVIGTDVNAAAAPSGGMSLGFKLLR